MSTVTIPEQRLRALQMKADLSNEMLEVLKTVADKLYVNRQGEWMLKNDFSFDLIDKIISKAEWIVE